MTTLADLVFVGISRNVLALHRDTGEIVWENCELDRGYTTLLLDGDRLIVSANGYIYCLDALTGRPLWKNPLSGYGTGATSLASVRGGSASEDVLRFQQESADSQDSSTTTSSTPTM